eukprot:3940224-Karenia_brevis.AAC.1
MAVSSVIWIGKSGIAKTPVMCILSMLWSTFHIARCNNEYESKEKPGFRTAKYFDAFRGEDGSITKPCQFDDGRLS